MHYLQLRKAALDAVHTDHDSSQETGEFLDDVQDLLDSVFEAAEDESSLNPFTHNDAKGISEDRLSIVEGWALMEIRHCQQVETHGAETVLRAQGILLKLL
jgi:hypothetical protein